MFVNMSNKKILGNSIYPTGAYGLFDSDKLKFGNESEWLHSGTYSIFESIFISRVYYYAMSITYKLDSFPYSKNVDVTIIWVKTSSSTWQKAYSISSVNIYGVVTQSTSLIKFRPQTIILKKIVYVITLTIMAPSLWLKYT